MLNAIAHRSQGVLDEIVDAWLHEAQETGKSRNVNRYIKFDAQTAWAYAASREVKLPLDNFQEALFNGSPYLDPKTDWYPKWILAAQYERFVELGEIESLDPAASKEFVRNALLLREQEILEEEGPVLSNLDQIQRHLRSKSIEDLKVGLRWLRAATAPGVVLPVRRPVFENSEGVTAAAAQARHEGFQSQQLINEVRSRSAKEHGSQPRTMPVWPRSLSYRREAVPAPTVNEKEVHAMQYLKSLGYVVKKARRKAAKG